MDFKGKDFDEDGVNFNMSRFMCFLQSINWSEKFEHKVTYPVLFDFAWLLHVQFFFNAFFYKRHYNVHLV